MVKTKKQMYLVIMSFVLVILLGGVTFALFNYTRVGSLNTIRVGRISFTSSQSNTISLSNIIPISREDALTDNINSSEVTISISGDTTYENGVEYLISLDDVHIETSTYKKIPIGIIVTPEKTGELGTSDNSYFTNRGGNSSIYKVLADETVTEDEYILVGYIKPGAAEINGTIGIRTFVDIDSIAVTDTYDGTESSENKTTKTWVDGRTVLTTDEWNSFEGNNSLSFKVKVEANEGIWVPEPTTRNDVRNFYNSTFYPATTKSTITDIEFIRMSEEMINLHSDAVDVTAINGEGMVKAWIEGTKMYVASPGTTYLPSSCGQFFQYHFPNLERIKFNNVDTSQVVSMYAMFDGLIKLESIDVTSFNTENVENMYAMFRGCSSLTSIDLRSFDTSNVTNMYEMFSRCTSLTSIDIDNFDLSKVNEANNMFYNCNNINYLDLSKVVFGNNTSLLYMFRNSGIKEVNLKGNKIYNNLGQMLNSSNVEIIDMTNVDASESYSLSNFFNGATKIKTIKASGMKFGTYVNGFIFSNSGSITSLEDVDLSNTDFSLTTSLGGFISGINCIKTINLSGANFSEVTSASSIVTSSSVESIDLSNSNFSKVTSTGGMFYNVSGNTIINLSNTNFSKVTSTSGMFSGSSPSSIILKNSTFNSLVTVSGMFYNLTTLINVDLTGINTSNVTYFSGMFDGCSSITTLDLSYLNTSSAIGMNKMFNGMSSLESINISGLGGNNLTNISDIFDNCSSLKSINMSNFNFGAITDLSGENSPFYQQYSLQHLNSLEKINLSGANMHNVTTMNVMFFLGDGEMATIKEIDMNNVNTSSLEDMSSMFENCEKLEKLNLSGIDTSNVTSLERTFFSCSNLVSLDLSSFNTSNVTKMDSMFYMPDGISLLKTIYVSNLWDISNVTSSNRMFYDCKSLVGGSGTTYNSSYTDKTYAHIDGGQSNPGYLTLKTN